MRLPRPFLLLVLLAAASSPVSAIEQPRYDVVRSEGDLEIRRYESYLVAETFVDASFGEAGNEGFRRLFRYISGANTSREEIRMTAPVSQQPARTRIEMTAPVAQSASGGGHWVSFGVPSSFTAESVPQPLDPNVRIREVPAQLVAVLRYAGTWRESRYQEEERRLREKIIALGLTAAGEAQFARYDPPYMPPFMRRNEILIPLAGDRAAIAATTVPNGLAPRAAN